MSSAAAEPIVSGVSVTEIRGRRILVTGALRWHRSGDRAKVDRARARVAGLARSVEALDRLASSCAHCRHSSLLWASSGHAANGPRRAHARSCDAFAKAHSKAGNISPAESFSAARSAGLLSCDEREVQLHDHDIRG
jgi:hypothetical protein